MNERYFLEDLDAKYVHSSKSILPMKKKVRFYHLVEFIEFEKVARIQSRHSIVMNISSIVESLLLGNSAKNKEYLVKSTNRFGMS